MSRAPLSTPDLHNEKNLDGLVENVTEYIDPQDGSKHQVDANTKLDPHGFPLSPQPSDYSDDPLVRAYLHRTNGRTGRPDENGRS